MAYWRSIIARSKLFYQQHQRFSPPLSHISGRDREESPAKRNPEMITNFLISRNNAGNSRLMRSEVPAGYGLLSGNVSRLMRAEVPAGYGLIFHRNMSKVPLDIAVAEKAVEAAPVANEVATAAATSISDYNIIQFVHCYTGLEWWASIAVAALFMRLAHIPFEVSRVGYYQNSKDPLSLLTAELIWWLWTEGGVYFSIVELVVKEEPSFKTGGILWFTDLSGPTYVELPILVALTYWANKNLDPFHFTKGARADEESSIHYGFGVVSAVGIVIGFHTGLYFYLWTYNLFAIASSMVMRKPRVQKLLGISLTMPHKAGK
ncbi:mitochondrial inner membrane protein OXA1-like [Salvia hispanica]|uniref:mitochondrial inner membrane protein OXA1-like n=1 Tax=Salvia hispanica TaxID=49212 RepID=UPI002009495B|nr:mitochondrial inner membrane protein OXA1-like [Salvia hispanica]